MSELRHGSCTRKPSECARTSLWPGEEEDGPEFREKGLEGGGQGVVVGRGRGFAVGLRPSGVGACSGGVGIDRAGSDITLARHFGYRALLR